MIRVLTMFNASDNFSGLSNDLSCGNSSFKRDDRWADFLNWDEARKAFNWLISSRIDWCDSKADRVSSHVSSWNMTHLNIPRIRAWSILKGSWHRSGKFFPFIIYDFQSPDFYQFRDIRDWNFYFLELRQLALKF